MASEPKDKPLLPPRAHLLPKTTMKYNNQWCKGDCAKVIYVRVHTSGSDTVGLQLYTLDPTSHKITKIAYYIYHRTPVPEFKAEVAFFFFYNYL